MRSFGLLVIKLISLIRYYGILEGINIFLSLFWSKKSYFIINSKVFKNKIYLRKGQSDPLIFEQIFCEQQYNFIHPNPESVKWIIDAGANIGLAAIYFSLKFPNSNIISIEPDKSNFELLKKNTSSYSNIQCINAALWHKEEQLIINNKEEKSAGFMVETLNQYNEGSLSGITIDNITDQFKIDHISLLKLDIEGAEKELFTHNPSLWMEKTECIITELHDWLKSGTSKVFFKEMSNYDWITFIKGENIICIKPISNTPDA